MVAVLSGADRGKEGRKAGEEEGGGLVGASIGNELNRKRVEECLCWKKLRNANGCCLLRMSERGTGCNCKLQISMIEEVQLEITEDNKAEEAILFLFPIVLNHQKSEQACSPSSSGFDFRLKPFHSSSLLVFHVIQLLFSIYH